MKRLIAAASLMAMMSVCVATSWAFTPQGKTTITAGTITGGTKVSSFTATVVAADGSTPASGITWSGVDPAVTSWKTADTIVRLTYNVTDVNGGIQIYTDNLNAAGTVTDPKFVDPSPLVTTNADSNPAGLLYVDGVSTGTQFNLPVAWSIKATTTAIASADPNNNGLFGRPTDPNAFQWLFMLDKNTPAIDRDGNGRVGDPQDSSAFVNGDPFVTMVKQKGIHFSQSPAEFGPDSDRLSFVYFEAEFSTALVKSQYQTTKLTIEAFTE